MVSQIINRLSNNKELYTILLVGDSSLSCEWVVPNWRGIIEYVIKDKIEKTIHDWQIPYLQLRFINSGLNGADTRQFLEFIPRDLDQFKPNMVIFMGGDNDIPISIPFTETLENLNKIRKILSSRTENFVFSTGQTTLDENHTIANLAYIKAIKAQKLYPNEIFLDLYQEFKEKRINLEEIYTFKLSEEDVAYTGEEAGSIDKHHCNRIGQAYVAESILEKVFNISFDPRLYLKTLDEGNKYPSY